MHSIYRAYLCIYLTIALFTRYLAICNKYYLYSLLCIILHLFTCRVNETTANKSAFFVLQRRRGHGEPRGLSSIFVGTLDSVFDTKPAPYRILHQTLTSEVYYGGYLFVLKHLSSAGHCCCLHTCASSAKQNNVSYRFSSERDSCGVTYRNFNFYTNVLYMCRDCIGPNIG